MIRIAYGAGRRFASAAALALATVLLASCGSGGVSNDNATGAGTGPVSVSPDSATLYSELPMTFALSGGSGSYLVTSSDQSVVPVASNIRVNRFTVVPADVGSDTSVTLTVRDANNATATPATATLTVKPRTISSTVTIVPSSTQAAACGTAICSGGDAEVRVVLSQAGVPLVGRTVRFDVASGDVRIITSAPGAATEDDELSGTSTTDNTGTARIRIRVLADAAAQTALLRVTDVDSGANQLVSVTIAPSSNAPLTIEPTSINFTGPNENQCASDVSADVIIVGGRPPYQVTQPAGFTVSPTVVSASGGRVTVTSTGQCARTGTGSTSSGVIIPDAGQTMAIVDSNGATASVLIHNDPAPVTAPATKFTVSPIAVTLDSCDAVANIALVGGGGPPYFAASGSSALAAATAGNIGTIQRTPSTTTTLTSIPVTFSDGQTVQDVQVTLSGAAVGPCP